VPGGEIVLELRRKDKRIWRTFLVCLLSKFQEEGNKNPKGARLYELLKGHILKGRHFDVLLLLLRFNSHLPSSLVLHCLFPPSNFVLLENERVEGLQGEGEKSPFCLTRP
jgi:hypothetical protein